MSDKTQNSQGGRSQNSKISYEGLFFLCLWLGLPLPRPKKREYVDLVCSASLAGRCTYASPGKGVRYRYARIEEIFLAYQSLIPFHRIIPKSKDIKSLENEKQELAGKILQQEKSLASNFDILTNASETAKKNTF